MTAIRMRQWIEEQLKPYHHDKTGTMGLIQIEIPQAISYSMNLQLFIMRSVCLTADPVTQIIIRAKLIEPLGYSPLCRVPHRYRIGHIRTCTSQPHLAVRIRTKTVRNCHAWGNAVRPSPSRAPYLHLRFNTPTFASIPRHHNGDQWVTFLSFSLLHSGFGPPFAQWKSDEKKSNFTESGQVRN